MARSHCESMSSATKPLERAIWRALLYPSIGELLINSNYRGKAFKLICEFLHSLVQGMGIGVMGGHTNGEVLVVCDRSYQTFYLCCSIKDQLAICDCYSRLLFFLQIYHRLAL